jgi:NitT/TauT family transport system substrate-binding protein
MRTNIGLVAGVLGAALALGIGAPAHSQTLKPLRVTIPVPAMVFYPLFVAVDKGFFATHGYAFEIISTAGDGPDIDALISGSVDFTISTPNRLFTAYEQGKPLLAAMNLGNRMGIECAMNKAIADRLSITEATPLEQKLRAMKGETVAGTRPGAFTYLLLVNYAKRVGLVPQQDVQLIGLGGASSMLPALENGQVAIACTGSPMPELAVSRGKAIAVTHNLRGDDPAFDDFLFELLYVRPDWAKANADVVRGVATALREAIAWMQDTPTETQLPEMRARFTGVPDALLTEILDSLKPAFRRDGIITEAAVDKAAKFLRDTGVITAQIPWQAVATNDYLPK